MLINTKKRYFTLIPYAFLIFISNTSVAQSMKKDMAAYNELVISKASNNVSKFNKTVVNQVIQVKNKELYTVDVVGIPQLTAFIDNMFISSFKVKSLYATSKIDRLGAEEWITKSIKGLDDFHISEEEEGENGFIIFVRTKNYIEDSFYPLIEPKDYLKERNKIKADIASIDKDVANLLLSVQEQIRFTAFY